MKDSERIRLISDAQDAIYLLSGITSRADQPGFDKAGDEETCTIFCLDIRRAVDAVKRINLIIDMVM